MPISLVIESGGRNGLAYHAASQKLDVAVPVPVLRYRYDVVLMAAHLSGVAMGLNGLVITTVWQWTRLAKRMYRSVGDEVLALPTARSWYRRRWTPVSKRRPATRLRGNTVHHR